MPKPPPVHFFLKHTPPIKCATSQGAVCKAAPYFSDIGLLTTKEKQNTTISGVDVMSTQSVYRQRSWSSRCYLLQLVGPAELNMKCTFEYQMSLFNYFLK